jgi:DNA-binding response OmpR family regulator
MLKILLIDDDPHVTQDMLTLFGYDVEVATDGYLGIQALHAAKSLYDLVILDVQMPRLDGQS